jgi:hypothetical protein
VENETTRKWDSEELSYLIKKYHLEDEVPMVGLENSILNAIKAKNNSKLADTDTTKQIVADEFKRICELNNLRYT